MKFKYKDCRGRVVEEKTQSVKLGVALPSTPRTSRTMVTLNNNELFLSKQVSRKAKSSCETKANFAKCN